MVDGGGDVNDDGEDVSISAGTVDAGCGSEWYRGKKNSEMVYEPMDQERNGRSIHQ